jgi:hypothetical protein
MNQSMAENMIASRHGSIVAEAERLAASGASFEALLPTLRRLTLEEFGRAFIEMPSIDLPALSKAMPAMASAEVQRNWTGASGIDLLRQSLTFVHQLSEHVLQYTGRPLAFSACSTISATRGSFGASMHGPDLSRSARMRDCQEILPNQTLCRPPCPLVEPNSTSRSPSQSSHTCRRTRPRHASMP